MKKVFIQGLGFVGAAMVAATSTAKDKANRHLYDVIGVDLDTEDGNKKVDAINSGQFPFMTSDQALTYAIKKPNASAI